MVKISAIVALVALVTILILRRPSPLDQTIGSESIAELLQTVERAKNTHDAASYLSLIYWPDIPKDAREFVIEA
jgi:hypothetical protein